VKTNQQRFPATALSTDPKLGRAILFTWMAMNKTRLYASSCIISQAESARPVSNK
jgi:hypothetical protein